MRTIRCLFALALVACGPLDARDLAPFPCPFNGSCPSGLYCVSGLCQASLTGNTGSTGTTGPSGPSGPSAPTNQAPTGAPAGYVQLATVSKYGASLAIDATDVYWGSWTIENSNVRTWEVAKVPKAGGTKTVITTGSDPLYHFDFLDLSAGTVFYSAGNIYTVSGTPPSPPPATFSAQTLIYGLHVYGGRLYWLKSSGVLSSCAVGGCSGPSTDVTLSGSVYGAAFADNRVVWNAGGDTTTKTLRTCTLPMCSNQTALTTETAYSITNIFADSTNAYYWKHSGYTNNALTDSLLMRCPFAGGSCTQISNLGSKDTGGGVSADTQIYFVEDSTLYVTAVPSFPTPTARGKIGAFLCFDRPCLAADASSVYVLGLTTLAKVPR